MSTMTIADANDVREHLTAGKTVQQVADLTGLPRSAVLGVIKNTKGWLHDTTRDVAYRPADEKQDPAEPAALGKAPVDELLTGAVDVDDKAVQRELRKTTEQIARLRQVVTAAQERTAAAREVAVLERRLAEAKARLKNATGRRPPGGDSPAPQASDGEVRAWAAKAGVECNAQGRVPKRVREQYNAAHQGAR